MLTTYTHKKLTWVDLESPTHAEIDALIKDYGIHPLVGEELLSPTVRPKVDLYDDCIYLILHFPTVGHTHNGKAEEEVDFIIGKNFLITVHYDVVDPLHEFSKVFEVNSLLDRGNIAEHGGYLFFYMMKEMYKHLAAELNELSPRLREIEERIFGGEENHMVREISKTGKALLDFRESIRFHKETLESFEVAGKQFFEPKFHYYLRALQGEYYKVYNQLENERETLVDLRDTNDSLLTTKTNETIKTLTVMAFLILPLSFLSQVFSMNTRLPIVGTPYDFEIVMGIMAGLAVALFFYFKSKKWL